MVSTQRISPVDRVQDTAKTELDPAGDERRASATIPFPPTRVAQLAQPSQPLVIGAPSERAGVAPSNAVHADEVRRRAVRQVEVELIESGVDMRTIPITKHPGVRGTRYNVDQAREYFFREYRDRVAGSFPRDIAGEAADQFVARNVARYKRLLAGEHDGYRALTVTGMALAIIHENAQGRTVDPRLLAAAQRIVATLEQRMHEAHATDEEIARLTTKVGRDMSTSSAGWEQQVTTLRQQKYYQPYTPPQDSGAVQQGQLFEPSARPLPAAQPSPVVASGSSEQARAAIAEAQHSAAEKLANREAHGRNIMNAKLNRGESVGGTARSYG